MISEKARILNASFTGHLRLFDLLSGGTPDLGGGGKRAPTQMIGGYMPVDRKQAFKKIPNNSSFVKTFQLLGGHLITPY